MAEGSNERVDTVIIGNGPSALILSYILHGHIPRYTGEHRDGLLHRKLANSSNLLKITPDLYNHFRSSLSYSAQALPVNTLLDTLLRPNGDTDLDASTCVEWHYEPEKRVPHIVLGNAPLPGGQWAENPVVASWDIGTLSYAEQLSLPGYTIAEHWRKTKGEKLPELIRPTRREVADYFAAYPAAVGIADAVRTSTNASTVSRIGDGFLIAPHNLTCRHLVLATGIFNVSIPPPPFLRPVLSLKADEGAVLVVGSGFTAADIIISTPPERKIIHLFNWDPVNRPSPLKGCHGSAYPEYAWIYRQMKSAADRVSSPKASKGEALAFIRERNWAINYEGFANARVISTSLDIDEITDHSFFGRRRRSSVANNIAPPKSMFGHRRGSSVVGNYPTVSVNIGRSSIGEPVRRTISSLRYAAGRRGSLSYLDEGLMQEVLPRNMNPRLSMSMAERPLPPSPPQDDMVSTLRRGSIEHDFALQPKAVTMITGQTLRGKIEGLDEIDLQRSTNDAQEHVANFEVAANVFAIGSLTGDSLVRFAFGGCAVVAGKIINGEGHLDENGAHSSNSALITSQTSPQFNRHTSPTATRFTPSSGLSHQSGSTPSDIKNDDPDGGLADRRNGAYEQTSGQSNRARSGDQESHNDTANGPNFSAFTMMQKTTQLPHSNAHESKRRSEIDWE